MTNNIFHFKHDQAAIVEAFDERQEHDRKTCIALYQKADSGDREFAQWLIDHSSYPNTAVAKWINRSEAYVRRLRKWAENGFLDESIYTKEENNRSRKNSSDPTNPALKTNDNLEDDTFGPSDDVEDPAQILTNILDSISHAKAVAEAYRKILKSSPFDREAKKQIYDAINLLIVKWRIVQSTLEKKGRGNAQSKHN